MLHPLDIRCSVIVAEVVAIALREIAFLKGLIERARKHALEGEHSFELLFKPDSWVYKLVYHGEPMNEDRDVLMSFKYLANRVLLRFFDCYATDFSDSETAERAIGGIKFWSVCNGPLSVIKVVLVSDYFLVARNRIVPHINNKMPRKSRVRITNIKHDYPQGGWTDIFL